MKKLLYLFSLAFFAGLFLFSTPCYASGHWEYEKEVLETRTISAYAEFERDSAGIWRSCTDASNAYFFDSDINYTNGKIKCRGTVRFKYNVSDTIRRMLQEDGTVFVSVEASGNTSCACYSDYSYSFSDNSTLQLDLYLNPMVSVKKTLGSFVSGLSKNVPLIDNAYGNNMYKVYPLVGNFSYCRGWYSDANPYDINSPYIHPSIIKNSKGAFVSGNTILFNGNEKKVGLYNIGKGSEFADGNAVRLRFNSPFKIKLYIIKSVWVEDKPAEPQTPKDPIVPDPEKPKDPSTPDTPYPEEPGPSKKYRIHRVR